MSKVLNSVKEIKKIPARLLLHSELSREHIYRPDIVDAAIKQNPLKREEGEAGWGLAMDMRGESL